MLRIVGQWNTTRRLKMTKFIFMQKTRDYYEVEADSEDEAIKLILSGDVAVRNTKYVDLDLIEEITL
jgi:hypothetical protein